MVFVTLIKTVIIIQLNHDDHKGGKSDRQAQDIENGCQFEASEDSDKIVEDYFHEVFNSDWCYKVSQKTGTHTAFYVFFIPTFA